MASLAEVLVTVVSVRALWNSSLTGYLLLWACDNLQTENKKKYLDSVYGDFSRKSQIFLTPRVSLFNASAEGSLWNCVTPKEYKKHTMMGLRGRGKILTLLLTVWIQCTSVLHPSIVSRGNKWLARLRQACQRHCYYQWWSQGHDPRGQGQGQLPDLSCSAKTTNTLHCSMLIQVNLENSTGI